MERGLPQALAAESVILGSILSDGRLYLDAASVLEANDFVLDKHQRIFRRMGDLAKRGDEINYTTVYYEMLKYGEAEADSISYMVGLSSGIPDGHRIDSYARLVKDASRRRKVIFTCESIRNRAMTGAETTEEIIGEATKSIFSLDNHQNGAGAEDIDGIIAEAGGVSAFLKAKHGVASPWPSFNRDTGGWQAGDLVIIAARPSMGKTALALNAIWYAASRNTPAVFYSYEMDKASIVRRLVSLTAHLPYADIGREEQSAKDRKAVADAFEEISNTPLRVVNASGWTALKVRMHMERLKRRNMISLAAVDYIGLMKPMAGASQNRSQELGETCRTLKEAAGELGVPLLVLSQLNRAVEQRPDKRPVMADLRDSGELENHADLIAFIHRAGYYQRDQASLQRAAELIIGKQRNGPCSTIKLQFREEWGKFMETDYGLEGE